MVSLAVWEESVDLARSVYRSSREISVVYTQRSLINTQKGVSSKDTVLLAKSDSNIIQLLTSMR